MYTINLRDAEIAVLAEQVTNITKRTLILNPGLTGTVTVVSAEALDVPGIWALFQSILRSRVSSPCRPAPSGRSSPRPSSGPAEGTPVGKQDVVTEMLRLDRLPSPEAVRVLRTQVAESGHLEAVLDPNAIGITDTRANVDRILEIAKAFDGDAQVRSEVVRIRNADAATVG